jgi:hypothetical protein
MDKRSRCRKAAGVRALQVLVAWSVMLSGSPERGGALGFRALLQPSAAVGCGVAAGSSAPRLAMGTRAMFLRSSPRTGILSAICAARKGGKYAVIFWFGVHRPLAPGCSGLLVQGRQGTGKVPAAPGG